ncbi:MAG: stress response translation initiation inhibitor YciH [Acidiplasma sp.]|nr:stress response translation initiation inhibitor YciH [Acidiplasma sp.]WMT54557.1 MAG: stress response translation initiation inhibitor YciH [Acidiplasma sp.]
MPKELQPWEGFNRNNEVVRISVDKRRYGKTVTVIEGIDPKSENLNDIAKVLKKKAASGGTVKDGKSIELQGDHRETIKKELENMGFKVQLV